MEEVVCSNKQYDDRKELIYALEIWAKKIKKGSHYESIQMNSWTFAEGP